MVMTFFELRLCVYETRRANRVAELERTIRHQSEKKRFIELIIAGDLVLARRPVGDIRRDLGDIHHFDPTIHSELLAMQLTSLTLEQIQKLQMQVDRAQRMYTWLVAVTPEELWFRDLFDLESSLLQKEI